MKKDFENTYKMKDVNKDKLQSLGFRYSKSNSDSENNFYLYRFPVHKYKKLTTIFCELLVEEKSGCAVINVYDANGNFYTPFYHDRYGNFSIMSTRIEKNILKELKKLEIEKRK